MENLLFAGGAQRLERPFGMARPARASVTKIQPAHRVVRSRVPSNLPADSGNRSVGERAAGVQDDRLCAHDGAVSLTPSGGHRIAGTAEGSRP